METAGVLNLVVKKNRPAIRFEVGDDGTVSSSVAELGEEHIEQVMQAMVEVFCELVKFRHCNQCRSKP